MKCFNALVVRLKMVFGVCAVAAGDCFNALVVRLKTDKQANRERAKALFQCLSGAIEKIRPMPTWAGADTVSMP